MKVSASPQTVFLRRGGAVGSRATTKYIAFLIFLFVSAYKEQRSPSSRRSSTLSAVSPIQVGRVAVGPQRGASHRTVCSPTAGVCDGQCVELASDPNHCGACSQHCSGSDRCRGGRCVRTGTHNAYVSPRRYWAAGGPSDNCSVGQTRCADGCVDLNENVRSCGRCGVSCLAGERCLRGNCVSATAWRAEVGSGRTW